MKFAIGTKKKMTQLFTEEGLAVPGTVIQVDKLVITQIKTEKKDGYNAVQVGFGKKNPKNISQAIKGHFKKALGDDSQNFRHLKEFRVSAEELANFKVG